MRILMLTNTYFPHVGGVARSVQSFAQTYRDLGNEVLVVAPEFSGQPETEENVVRIPAIQNFNGSDFSAVLPVSGLLTEELDKFRPEIVHAHHPYLLGMTALRVARYRQLPLVFTHHTLYEKYTHYIPGDSPALRRFVIELAIRYCNLANRVFAPSESISRLLLERGVHTPISVVPTGVAIEKFKAGDGARFRQQLGISPDAFVVGHLGRLAEEKNLIFLAECLIAFLKSQPRAHALIAGMGPFRDRLQSLFNDQELGNRFHIVGSLDGQTQADAYHAMDVFAFASKSETQGMVITEAMASGVPVVALDASGVRDVVRDQVNGRLLERESKDEFVEGLQWISGMTPHEQKRIADAALDTASEFSMANTAKLALEHYSELLKLPYAAKDDHFKQWMRLLDLIKAEWRILEGFAGAAGAAILPHEPDTADQDTPR